LHIGGNLGGTRQVPPGTGPGEGFTTTVVMGTDEPTSFFGKAVDRMLIPRALERDLSRSLDNLTDIFAVGIPE